MDLRAYYAKVREAEATLSGEYVVVVSYATPEGGKAGVLTEAPRAIAARLIAEGRGRAASENEAEDFRAGHREAKSRHDREEAARRIQVMVIPSQGLSDARENGEGGSAARRNKDVQERG